VKRAFPVPEHLYPFESRWQVVDGLPVHYIDEGQGQPLLFLHGNPTWSFLYRDIVRGLRDRYRCIALDYPGMGLSGKPRDHDRGDYRFTPEEHSGVLRRFVQALDLTDLTVMVQDWGGPIGMGMMTAMPERIARIVIGNTWAWPMDGLDIQLFSRGLGSGLGRQLILRRNLFVEKLLPGGVRDRSRMTPEVMACYRGPYPTAADREPTAVLPLAITRSRPFLAELESRLPRLADKPVQLLWGHKDMAFKERELYRWRGLFPHARVEHLRRASHFIQEDAPDQIVKTIQGFVG
jgi:haloalkane dehalogenase